MKPKRSRIYGWAMVLLLATGCSSRTSAATRSWDDELTGAIAQVNDVIALDLLVALVGMPEGSNRPVVDPSDSTPDLPRVEAACVRLEDLTPPFASLAASAPPERTEIAPKVVELGMTLARASARCQDLAQAGDPTAIVGDKDLSADFSTAGALEAAIGSQLHSDAECPERLRATVRTCAKA